MNSKASEGKGAFLSFLLTRKEQRKRMRLNRYQKKKTTNGCTTRKREINDVNMFIIKSTLPKISGLP